MQEFQNDHFSYKIWLPLLLAMVTVGGMVIGTQLQTPITVVVEKTEHAAQTGMGAGKVEELVRYLDARYVDTIQREELLDEAIGKVLFQLDPHSVYTSKEKADQFRGQMEGKSQGLGIVTLVDQDTLLILYPVAGGPAERAGVRPGDKLVQLFDSLEVGENLPAADISDRLKVPAGTAVSLGLLNKDGFRTVQVKIGEFPEPSLDAAYRIDDETAYVRLARFGSTTVTEFNTALDTLRATNERLDNLVLDLRDNPGGYLNEATDLLNQLFSERGTLLVYTQGRQTKKTEYKTNGRSRYDFKRIILLVNEGSASASEIVAGALQDWDRGLIIGRRTYGKGLVQEQYELRDGSNVRITVSRYFTPSGRSIQRDYSNKKVYKGEVDDRLTSGELFDGIIRQPLSDSTVFETASGRPVFANGGITPDLFIPIDTTVTSEAYSAFEKLIPIFAVRWVASPENTLSMPMSIEQFTSDFHISAATMQSFRSFAAVRDVRASNEYWRQIKPELRTYLKARIAHYYFRENGYYQVLNSDDPFVQKAVQYLRSPTPLVLNLPQ